MKRINFTNIPPVKMYNQYGFSIIKAYNSTEVEEIKKFSVKWLYKLINSACEKEKHPLEKYHLWWETLKIQHEKLFCAKNRYQNPGAEVQNLIINARVKLFFDQIGMKQYDLWDEGLGWLGFRFIRPGVGDGYPMSKKEWGPAKNVVSCWIPVIGHSPSETITLVPGSHLKEHLKFLPPMSKFNPDEFRLAEPVGKSELYNPSLKPGDVIFYHPKILHSEDVTYSDITRLNLEFRINQVATY